MKSKLLVVLAMAVGLLVVAGPMFAHHAQSYYDRDRFGYFEGNGDRVRVCQSPCANSFRCQGRERQRFKLDCRIRSAAEAVPVCWTKYSLKTGDLITVTGFPSKAGQKISIRKLGAPDGKILDQGAE